MAPVVPLEGEFAAVIFADSMVLEIN